MTALEELKRWYPATYAIVNGGMTDDRLKAGALLHVASFVWDATPQGFAFWAEIWEGIRNV